MVLDYFQRCDMLPIKAGNSTEFSNSGRPAYPTEVVYKTSLLHSQATNSYD